MQLNSVETVWRLINVLAASLGCSARLLVVGALWSIHSAIRFGARHLSRHVALARWVIWKFGLPSFAEMIN